MMKSFSLPCLFIFLLLSCHQDTVGVDAVVKEEMDDYHIPGLAVAVIKKGEVVKLKGYGYRDLEKKLEVDIHTPFHIASVSKVVVSACIFKLVENGLMKLENDINDYLPFNVVSPHFPQGKITVSQLLKHRSGIIDDLGLLGPIWSITKGDSPISLSSYLESYLVPDGEMYDETHFTNGPDPHGFSYSNIGYALLGLMIENTAQADLESYCQEQIFKPLGMDNSSWFLKNLDETEVAKSYTYSMLTGHSFNGHNGYPDFPAGQLRTSIADFSHFIQGYLNDKNGHFILEPATLEVITPLPNFANEGFYTWSLKALGNQLYYAHGGGDIGVGSQVVMDVFNRNAIIIFINGEHDLMPLIGKIEKEMF